MGTTARRKTKTDIKTAARRKAEAIATATTTNDVAATIEKATRGETTPSCYLASQTATRRKAETIAQETARGATPKIVVEEATRREAKETVETTARRDKELLVVGIHFSGRDA